MSRDIDELRLEVEYLKELLAVTDTARVSVNAAAGELSTILTLAATTAGLELSAGSHNARLECLEQLVQAAGRCQAGLLEAMREVASAGELLGGRILVVGREAGVELDGAE